MMTLRQFSAEPPTIPNITSWYLADLSKAQGKQELLIHQSSQKLKILREHALKAELVECLGRYPGAVWRKRGNTLKKG
ncbi:hypothetical protein ACFL1Z_03210 [Thermodesulfobacteriota bacterium]